MDVSLIYSVRDLLTFVYSFFLATSSTQKPREIKQIDPTQQLSAVCDAFEHGYQMVGLTATDSWISWLGCGLHVILHLVHTEFKCNARVKKTSPG